MKSTDTQMDLLPFLISIQDSSALAPGHPQTQGSPCYSPGKAWLVGAWKAEHCSLSLSFVTEGSAQPFPEFAAWEVTHAQPSTLEEGEILLRAGGAEDCGAEVVEAGWRAPGHNGEMGDGSS